MNKFKIEKQKHERIPNKGIDNKCDVCEKELYRYHYVIHNTSNFPKWIFGWVCSKRCIEMYIFQNI
jgi:hypothetical protein